MHVPSPFGRLAPGRSRSKPILSLLVVLSVVLAGCSAQGSQGGGGSGDAVVSAIVDFEADCGDGTCTLTATLDSTDGTDEAVHLYAYDEETRSTRERLYTFEDPASQVGESATVSVPRGSHVAVVLQRAGGGTDVTQVQAVDPAR